LTKESSKVAVMGLITWVVGNIASAE
jgi:hypothetical protein